ncbi:MAG: alpha-rhamnosidase [Prevotella sp.]|nr:alpha-rhamnosidase [Prevotella sp.]
MAQWIWYPGDFEIWLGNRFNNRRTERGTMLSPFWKQDSHWVTVEFRKTVTLPTTTRVNLYAEGRYRVSIDGWLQFGMPETLLIPAGEHLLSIKVHNVVSPPALLVVGEGVDSDNTWQATYEDKIWIDEEGVAHGSGIYVAAGTGNLSDPDRGPSMFALARRRVQPAKLEERGRGVLVDFGKETMGYLVIEGLEGEGMLNIYYGESEKEALDRAFCETLDQIEVTEKGILDLVTLAYAERTDDYVFPESKAFRHVYLEGTGNVRLSGVALDYEYSVHDPAHSGAFRCNDEELNRIWDVSAYTLDLTTREFFTDGIKRDRWTWSGDAIQSYLMNYYLRFDIDCVKRTIRQLRGKDPVTTHVNTIMDYTFYWFKSIQDYHLYTGDLNFVREAYPLMRTLMDYCLKRANKDGMMEGQADDWVFVDWVDFPMRKRGTLCFEQLLFCKSLETMAQCAKLLSEPKDFKDPPRDSLTTADYASYAENYARLAHALREKLRPTFWDEERHAFIHAIEEGQPNTMVTKFPNMFAILYGYADDEEQKDILHHVLLNNDVPPITTPYMRFYELEALCMADLHTTVLEEMKAYWGGMLREGATTFWEKYIPTEHGAEHLAMYGRPYGKSLCHAWGASPLYLLGRYFLGVRPTLPGYAAYEVRPMLGGLQWMEGKVPTPHGLITVHVTPDEVTVHSDGGEGTLVLGEQRIPIPPGKEIVHRR